MKQTSKKSPNGAAHTVNEQMVSSKRYQALEDELHKLKLRYVVTMFTEHTGVCIERGDLTKFTNLN